MINHINDSNFKEEILENKGPVLVDFWAPWCMPCKMMGPMLEKADAKYNGDIKICKVNVDEAPQTASNYQIMSIPTVAFFQNGKIINQTVGVASQEKLEEDIDSAISTAAKK